ncbi:hypothetical protein C3L33_04080, partial [Rhododendron williamsianum]
MPPASGVASPSERVPTTMIPTMVQAMASEAYAKDAIISWFRGEFAAANAIIDALCNHLRQLEVLDYSNVLTSTSESLTIRD